MSQENQLHRKYRPRNLDRVIGQEGAVKRLRGILASKKFPSSMLFVGPSSAGKTSLARAFVAEMFGVKSLQHNPDFHELNSASSRGVDDVRALLKTARLKPRVAPRRVFLFDEAQGFTGDSQQLLLKPLEEPPPSTMFILGSMEPEKLKAAMKNRCTTFVLQSPSEDDLAKYAKRVIKGEFDIKFPTSVVEKIIHNSGGEMRNVANIIQSIVEANPEGLKKIKESDIIAIIESSESNDDVLAVNILASVYRGDYHQIYRQALDVQGSFAFIGKLLTMNSFLINNTALRGDKHKMVWWSKPHIELNKMVKNCLGTTDHLTAFATVQSRIIDLRVRSGAFMVNENALIADALYKAAVELKSLKPLPSSESKKK